MSLLLKKSYNSLCNSLNTPYNLIFNSSAFPLSAYSILSLISNISTMNLESISAAPYSRCTPFNSMRYIALCRSFSSVALASLI
jgi:hypothetical protein